MHVSEPGLYDKRPPEMGSERVVLDGVSIKFVHVNGVLSFVKLGLSFLEWRSWLLTCVGAEKI